jgi:hypothetical protein
LTKGDLVNRALHEFIQRRRLAGARGDDHLSALEVVGYLLFVCGFVVFALAGWRLPLLGTRSATGMSEGS